MAMELHEESDRLARNLDWNLLRTFIAIVQEQSITKAAQRLRLKQPTVSNALRRLEERLGKRLILRSPARQPAGLAAGGRALGCLLYTSPSPRDLSTSRMPSSA